VAERPTASDAEMPASGRLTVLSGTAPALWLVWAQVHRHPPYGIMNSTLLWLSDTRLLISRLGLQRDAYDHSAHDIV
jgi:hypothetical protein